MKRRRFYAVRRPYGRDVEFYGQGAEKAYVIRVFGSRVERDDWVAVADGHLEYGWRRPIAASDRRARALAGRLDGEWGAEEWRIQARMRVDGDLRLREHGEVIWYDWSNWRDHVEWLTLVPISQIIEWAEGIEAQEAEAVEAQR